MKRLLAKLGLASARELKDAQARVDAATTAALRIPDRLAELFDVSSGRLQEMHIDVHGMCSDLYTSNSLKCTPYE